MRIRSWVSSATFYKLLIFFFLRKRRRRSLKRHTCKSNLSSGPSPATSARHYIQYSEKRNAGIIWVIVLGKRRLKNKLMAEGRPSEDGLQLFSCCENRMKGRVGTEVLHEGGELKQPLAWITVAAILVAPPVISSSTNDFFVMFIPPP